MSTPSKVLLEDAKAILMAFDKDDFTLMNIFSNRLLSNILLLGDDTNYIPGFFFKDVAFTFQRLQYEKSDSISTVKSICRPILNDVNEYFISNKKSEEYWGKYLEFYLRMRNFLITDIEKEAYTTNLEFTDNSFNWLIKFLVENKEILKNNNNQLLSGLLNEMDRIIRCHSGNINNVIMLALIRALNYLYVYMLFIGESEPKKIYPYIDKISEINDAFDYNASHILLKEILIEWRQYFLKYMDVAIEQRKIMRGFKIPENVKEKLSESISKTLQEELIKDE